MIDNFAVPARPIPVLSEDDVAELHQRVSAEAMKAIGPRPPVWRALRGGPLDGLRAALTEPQSRIAILGWVVSSERKLVQVLYQHEGDVLRFRHLL